MQISGKHWFFDILFRHPGDNIVLILKTFWRRRRGDTSSMHTHVPLASSLPCISAL